MSKRARHAKVLEIIKHHRVASQEGLRELLHAQGTEVTQATLSRDIRELRLVKVPDAEGASHYSLPEEWESPPPLQSLLPALYASAEGSVNLLVVRTMTGGAQAGALAIDWDGDRSADGTAASAGSALYAARSVRA